MKTTMDTNVLISATFWYGDSFRIIENVESGKVKLVLSKEILKEYEDVLEYPEIRDKIKDNKLEAKLAAKKIEQLSIVVVPKERLDVVPDDPKDNKIIECAVAGEVDYLVSQDNHLLKVKEFRGIRIITPKKFLDILESNKR